MKMRGMIVALTLAAGTVAAQAVPRAALFVQNRAGARLDSQLDVFTDLVSTRLSDAGFEVVRPQDVLARFTESRRAESAQELRQSMEALQSVKSEGTVDGPLQEASALRIAQLMEADLLVFASLVSLGENRVRTQSYGVPQEATITTLRVALRVLDGDRGAQLFGDTIAATEKVMQNANVQVDAGDMLNQLLDRGAVELADRVRRNQEKIASAMTERPALAAVTFAASAAGAAVEVDGVVMGTAPGTFQVRPGVHEVRLTREGYATWEKSMAFVDGQTIEVSMELSAVGLDRKGELEEQARVDDIAREQSAADAAAKTSLAEGAAKQMSESYIRLEGMPEGSLTIGETSTPDAQMINVIQQEVK
jgi:hypothetical protein